MTGEPVTPIDIDDYRLVWATHYWSARDAGMSTQEAVAFADESSEPMLDELED